MVVPTDRASFKEYCLDNKYSRWYFSIIDKAIDRCWNKDNAPCYVEGHHFIPRSLGGNDDTIVFLTAREHFICHILLTKILISEDKAKMVWAVMCLKGKSNRYHNSILYEAAKKDIRHTEQSKLKMSRTRIQNGTVKGERNPMFGKRGPLSPIFGMKQSTEHKEKRLSKIRGRKQSLESRSLMSLNRPKGPSGKKWFNNGLVESFDLPENKPDSFIFGRLKRT